MHMRSLVEANIHKSTGLGFQEREPAAMRQEQIAEGALCEDGLYGPTESTMQSRQSHQSNFSDAAVAFDSRYQAMTRL
jgi:hypothetical protein